MKELPTLIDQIRLEAARERSHGLSRELGQYFTPWPLARLMASMAECSSEHIRLLDAGAGSGCLAAAWLALQCDKTEPPQSVHVVAYELDATLLPSLERTLRVAKKESRSRGISVTWEIRNVDFIANATKALCRTSLSYETFDIAILNPPYRKIRSDSESRLLLRTVGIETSNLYAAFIALALRLLVEHGELVAITPRSFCNGPYFKPFRLELLRSLNIKRMHSFESRNRAFAEDRVLQENIILHGIKGEKQGDFVVVSSNDHPDDPDVTRRSVPFANVVRRDDREVFIHVVPNELGQTVAVRSRRMPANLGDLGLSVSTGRVVDFRARDHLAPIGKPGTVPLIYPRHFSAGYIEWPKPHAKKADAIKKTAARADLLLKAGVYVLVKRFSAKEERRRVVAAVFDPGRVPCDLVGFENHVNFFHQSGKPLPRTLALGLTAYLNSTFLDHYFRQFSGHTQVNATDLRNLRYPTLRALEKIGSRFAAAFPAQPELDAVVDAVIDQKESVLCPELPLEA